MKNRCEECGSWGEECMADAPVKGCACARCANAALHKSQIREAIYLTALRNIETLFKLEVCKDEFAYDRMVETYRSIARAAFMKADKA